MFQALAGLLAFFYDVVGSYAFAITMLTLTVMLVLSPLTVKSTRNMLAMQRLQPELKKLQVKHKNDRQKLNEEMMAFYREHKVNPVAGCIPMLLQMPVFIVMYRVIDGLNKAEPKYLDKDSALYRALLDDAGKMPSLGIDLANSASKAISQSFTEALPFIILIALVVATQYFQTKQMTNRNPQAAAANPQMQMMTRVMPVMFGFISYGIPAGVNVYFLVSALFRIAQQEAMYRFDPHVSAHHKERQDEHKKGKTIDTKAQDVPKEDPLPNGSPPKPVNKAGQGGGPGPSKNKKKKKGR